MTVTVSPRTYSRHQRHRLYARVRLGADQFAAFLSAQAIRLSGSDTDSNRQTIFGKLLKYTADRIRQATNLSQIP